MAESCEALVKAIDNSQIVMLPGGFSGGDEPDGSAKFIASFFRNPEVTEAVRRLLQQRDGLMLGICNGFQALIKLGLVPYGDIRPITACDPTPDLQHHRPPPEYAGAHPHGIHRQPVAVQVRGGRTFTVAISHGEGRFVAPQEVLDTIMPTPDRHPVCGLERRAHHGSELQPQRLCAGHRGHHQPGWPCFGKMGHSERSGEYLYKNVTGDKYQPIFEGGVDYFKV